MTVYSQCCTPLPLSSSKIFPLSQKKTLWPLSSHSQFSSPPAPGNYQSVFYLCRFTYSGYFIKVASHNMWTSVCLFHLSIMFLRFINIVMHQHFILFNGWVTLLCMYPFICWWTFGLFLPFDCCENCYHEHLCTSVWMSVINSFEYTPGVVIFNGLTSWGTAKLFSIAGEPFYFSTSNGWRLQFLHVSSWFWCLDVWNQGICRVMLLLKASGKNPSLPLSASSCFWKSLAFVSF